MRKGKHGIAIAILYILIGGIVGSVLGQLLAPLWAPIGKSLLTVGAAPGRIWSVDLGVIGISVGAWLNLNVLGVIGLVAGLFAFGRRGS